MPQQPTKLSILSWNIEEGLNKPKRLAQIRSAISQYTPDIVFMPEALNRAYTGDEHGFDDLGYTVQFVAYEDRLHSFMRSRNRTYKLDLGLLTRVNCNVQTIRLDNSRNAILLKLRFNKSELTIACIHLDDRAEDIRLGMIKDVVAHHPDIIIGDFNSLQPQTWQARILRLWPSKVGAWLFNAIMPIYPYKNLPLRLQRMANGGTVSYLEHHGYRNVTHNLGGTIKAGPVPIAQIDHVFSRAGIEQTVKATRLKLNGSDHYPVIIEVS